MMKQSTTVELTRGELLAVVDGCASNDRSGSELPDPWGWVDFISNPDVTVAAVERRVLEGRTPLGAQMFKWPKEKGGWRPMAWLDPLDQIFYRAAVGRLVEPITASIDVESVLSARLATQSPAWTFASWNQAIGDRRHLAAQLLDQHPVMGVFDVENFFPNVTRKTLETVYSRLPLHVPSFSAVLDWLDDLASTYRVRGLPTGPEASRMLANGLLGPCDAVVAQTGAPFVRYVDDTWFFVDDLRHYGRIREGYEEQLSVLGLKLNESKSKPLIGDEARNEVERLAIAYLGDTLKDQGVSGLDAALELFSWSMEDPRARKSELRTALRHLATHHDPHPFEVLKEDLDLLGIAPYHWVKYLRALRLHGPTRNLVDDGWLVEGATATLTRRDAYQNLLLLRATTGTRRLSPELGKQILKVATDDSSWSAPVRSWAVRVWSMSEAYRPGVAAEQISVRGDLSTRRAFAMTLKGRSDHNEYIRWCTQVRRTDRDLEPTAAWLEAA